MEEDCGIQRVLLDSDGLGQVTGTIDVFPVQFGDVVAEKLERDDGENVLNAIHGPGHAENVLQTGEVSLGHVVIRDDDGAPSSRKHLLQGIERLLVDVVLADDHHNAQLIVHHARGPCLSSPLMIPSQCM
ncbi:hypothetical protein L596_004745 [Steinernema carpocapsae]|uniref:Uncharacterized protein n=1 Tax=Steinernema carpocapsae TaxID=34508 RepID=A0A4U8V0X4_STECR|nr:hypothetical protein L596_004745 [Steinernema carpocapsae]